MSDFFEWFRNKYQAEFPIALSLPLQHREQTFWVSTELAQLEHPPMVPEFYEQPNEYALAGEWGRGVNSYAFYFAERRGQHRRFFRIFSGGVYGRPEEDAKIVVGFLAGYESWRARFEGELSSSTIVYNMGNGTAELVRSNGDRLSHVGREEGAAFWEALLLRMS
jgi:hypothetical protein